VSVEAFLGVAIMDIQSCPERKNPWAHVRAWQRAFGDDPSAVLVIKVRVGKRTRLVVDELREMIGSATNIRVMTEELTNDQIAALQHASDVYLSLHRSEGFGLNIAECLLIGKPVVATHWSANVEFGPHYPNYHPVTSRQTPYRDWLLHYEDTGFTWADADVDDAALKLKAIRAQLPPPSKQA
jgi:glycosyltransferase involved in cell wall biosynthesis